MLDLTLRGYQQGMREFALARPRCALWADMGLGKTCTALHVAIDCMHDRLDVGRWLVVAPRLVALDTWPRQLRLWRQFAQVSWRCVTAADFGLRADWVETGVMDPDTLEDVRRRAGLTFGGRGLKAAVKRALREHRERLHLVSWDMLPWLVKAYGVNWPYDGLILDEAIFAGNSTSARHRALWHVIHRLRAVSRVVELTGRPTPNGYEMLHGQIRLLDGGAALGRTKAEFLDAWMEPDRVDRRRGIVYSWKLAPGAKERIDELVRPLAVSLRREDYLSLPPCVVNPIWVDLPDAARTAYEALERDFLLRVGLGIVLAPNEASKAAKLLQIANGAVYDSETRGAWEHVHSAKLDKLVELVEGCDGPLLLAYRWRHDWQRVVERLGKRVAVHKDEAGALDRFRAGRIKVLGVQPSSGAHGLDGLQDVSNTAVWFGATYDADHWEQFNARLHRDGQRAGRVVVHQILAADTIEEYVAGGVLPGKLGESEALLQAVSMRLHCAASDVSPTNMVRDDELAWA